MTHEQEEYSTHEDKIKGLGNITQAVRNNQNPEDAYVIDQNSFKDIGRYPFVYWFGAEVLKLFVDNKNLNDVAKVMDGLTTGDDDQFVMNWWEIEKHSLDDKYTWLEQSGEENVYYDSTEKAVFWENSGDKIIEYEDSYPRNREYYGNRGIVYRDFSKYFTARIHPEDHIFSSAIYYVYPEEYEDLYGMLGYLSSSLTRFIAAGLNPTLHFKGGDGERLPIKEFDSSIGQLVRIAIEYQKEKASLREIKSEFPGKNISERLFNSLYLMDMYEADIQVIHGIIDDLIFKEFNLSQETIKNIYEDLPQNLSNYPHITNAGDLDTKEKSFRSQVPTIKMSSSEYEELKNEIKSLNDNDVRSISEELEVSPYTVAKVRDRDQIYTNDEMEKSAGRLISYYIGCAMGRWDPDGLDPDDDGIIGLDGEMESYIQDCIKMTFGGSEYIDKKAVIGEMLDRDLEDWLQNRFFRYHHCKEYRRRGQRIPIYWQLESPEGAFSCFIYYHKINTNTLPKLRGQYLDPRIDELENELETLNAQTSGDDPDKELLNRKEQVQNDLDDIREFRDTIDEMIDDSVSVDVEKGIWENIKEWDQYEVLETGLPKLKSSYSR